jgi:hypothetical protein
MHPEIHPEWLPKHFSVQFEVSGDAAQIQLVPEFATNAESIKRAVYYKSNGAAFLGRYIGLAEVISSSRHLISFGDSSF